MNNVIETAAAVTFAQQQKPTLTEKQLNEITKDELVLKWHELEQYTNQLQDKFDQNVLDSQIKLTALNTQKSIEIARLKNIILTKYVSSKEQESTNQFKEPRQSRDKSASDQQQIISFVDPSINDMIVQLKKELDETRRKKDDLKLELDSWKFNPESQMVKRLMVKCRKLLKENEELGKVISSGNVAQLEHDLAYHKEILNEACENEQNINSFLSEMDNEMEAMQATILHLNEQIILSQAAANSSKDNNKQEADQIEKDEKSEEMTT